MPTSDEDSSRLGPLLLIFLRLANLTFGGGAATVAALQRELVEKRHWLSTADFGLSYALSRITPGTNLYAFCTAAAWLIDGTRSAILALVISSLPCCALVWLLTAGFDHWSNNIWVKRGIEGALAACVALLLASFWIIIRPFMKRTIWMRNIIIVAVSIVLSLYFQLTPILVLAIAATAGWFWAEAPTE